MATKMTKELLRRPHAPLDHPADAVVEGDSPAAGTELVLGCVGPELALARTRWETRFVRIGAQSQQSPAARSAELHPQKGVNFALDSGSLTFAARDVRARAIKSLHTEAAISGRSRAQLEKRACRTSKAAHPNSHQRFARNE